jgi:hypothetical protein
VPLPVAAPVILMKELLLAAVQLHTCAVLTPKLRLPPEDANTSRVGEIENEQVCPDCVTVKGCPAIVIVPVRDAVSGLGETLKSTVPVPLPEAPELTVMKGEFDVAFHAHPEGAITVTLPLPPEDGNASPVGKIEDEQGLWAACVTVKLWPAMSMVLVRELRVGFGRTSNVTVAGPVPLVGEVMFIQLALFETDQPHPLSIVRSTEPDPPVEVKD